MEELATWARASVVRRGFFYEAWARTGATRGTGLAPATECARIPAKFLEEERRNCREGHFRQEYRFVNSVDGLFDREAIDEAVVKGMEELPW